MAKRCVSAMQSGASMRNVYKPLVELLKVAAVFLNDEELSRIFPQRNPDGLIRRVAKDRLFHGMIPADSSVITQRLLIDDQIGNIDSVVALGESGLEIQGWSDLLKRHCSVDAAFLEEM